eukprot:g5408.t1
MALRGATSEDSTNLPKVDGQETVEAREEVEEWDPLPDQNFSERGPVKGGVEVYPLQPARRQRKATTPLLPEVAEIEGTLTAWKMPKEYTHGGGGAIKGLYVMFHGCNHGPLDWFDLPEERTIVSTLVNAGYAVLAPASKDRDSGCWKVKAGNGDIDPVKAVLWRWYRDWSISPTTPLFLFGASSGGNMATILASKGGFQLCDKRTTYVQVSGVMSQVSWGVPPTSYGKNCPPIGFMPMPKGEVDSGDEINENIPQIFGNSRKIPAQISSIAHYVRKSGGRPRMLLLPVGELSLYKAFFSDRVYEISPSQSERLYNALVATRAMQCKSKKLVGGEPECFLAANPREAPLTLDTLVTTYMATLHDSESEASQPDGSGNVNGNSNSTMSGAGAAAETNGSLQLFNRREDEQPAPGAPSGPLPILQPATGDGATGADQGGEKKVDMPAMSEHHATEVFRELLNVAWGAHELTADFSSAVLEGGSTLALTMDESLASAIAATQEQLGGLFQKPRLSEKLLSKAPFRFLHDVVSAVTASTGFAAGLYSGEELDSGSIKDKASKINYLDKIVALVGICSGHDIDVRPSKVVAGLEPEGTNALLTALGRCARSQDLDFDEAVRRALSGESPGQNPPPLRAEGGSGSGSGGDGRGARVGDGGGGAEETKAEVKVRSGEGDGGAGDGRRGSGAVADEKASAKQEIEQMGQAAKAMGVPQSRRLSSRAGGGRAEAKTRSNSLGTGGLGDDPSGIGGRDLTAQIEACTGDIAVTRQMLEAIISRPKLSDKLLNMPPFRFLHDIVSEVTRQTGFGQGLYSDDELDSGLVKAKPAKMAYLDKLIMLIGSSLNTLVEARPNKIVAGLEAENTNRMLQLLALAAVEKPDSSRAVAVVLDTAPVKRRSSTGSDVAGTAAAAATAVSATDRERDRPQQQEQPQQQQQQQQQRRASSATSDAIAPAAAAAAERGGSRGSSAGETKGDVGRQEAAEDKSGGDSARGDDSKDIGAAGTASVSAEPPRSMRPRTARRRPPAVKDDTKDFADSGRAQVPDDPTAAPKVANININIMMDGDGDQESDDEEVGEAVHVGGMAGGGSGAGAKGEGGHTAMVADILKEKEKAEERAKEADAEAKGRGDGQEAKGSASGSAGGGIRMGRLRGAGQRSSSSSAGGSKVAGGGGGATGYGDADVAKLKEAIQTLCQSTHPLGKCMDFVHEDLSLMSQEMDRWRALHKVKAKALEAERATTVAFLEPLKTQLRDLEDQLKESSMKIDGVKAGISANDKKINNLLKMMITS